VPAIEHGYFQREIALSAMRQQQEIEQNQRTIVGLNDFEEGNDEANLDILKITDAPEKQQRERLAKLRATRDQKAVDATLEALREAARTDANVIPPMLDAVRAYATLYEIRRAMEDVFGAYKEPLFF